MRFRIFITAVLFLLLAGVVPAAAQYGRTPDTEIDPSVVRIDEDSFLGVKVNSDREMLTFDGREFTLAGMLGKPVILVFSYFSCDGSCPIVNASLADTIKEVDSYTLGEDYNILTLSFDANDKKENIGMFEKMAGLGSAERAGWRVAVFKDPAWIKDFTGSVGYRYFWSKRDKTFVHPSVFIFLSPEGRVTRYLYSSMAGARDVEVAIAEAGFGTPGKSKAKDLTDLLLIACFSYNYEEGRYTLNYPLFIATGSLVGGLSLIGFAMVISKKKARR
jgi:protein SCO1/2